MPVCPSLLEPLTRVLTERYTPITPITPLADARRPPWQYGGHQVIATGNLVDYPLIPIIGGTRLFFTLSLHLHNVYLIFKWKPYIVLSPDLRTRLSRPLVTQTASLAMQVTQRSSLIGLLTFLQDLAANGRMNLPRKWSRITYVVWHPTTEVFRYYWYNLQPNNIPYVISDHAQSIFRNHEDSSFYPGTEKLPPSFAANLSQVCALAIPGKCSIFCIFVVCLTVAYHFQISE